jgi:prevent-host-death family protein
MGQTKTLMKTISRDEAQQKFAEILRQVAAGETRVTIEEEGEPTVLMVAAKDYQADLDRAVFEMVGRAFEDQTPEQIEREVDRAIREGRRRKRESDSSYAE